MPHRKKKAFIEKRKAVTFHLVHRSQRDPLVADEKAPQHVLLPTSKVEAEKRREDQRQFGVFFDDDYDYLQHLKEPMRPTELVYSSLPPRGGRVLITEDGKEEEEEIETRALPAISINLPSSVFASEFEEEVGLLNKAAPISGPRLDMDPDIVEALDEDFDFDNPKNVLEDDFILKANSVVADDNEEDGDEWEDTDKSESSEEEENDDCNSDGPLSENADYAMREFLFADEETKSRFTEYSLTSSVMKRNEQLTLLDDRFEKFFEQFDDDEIGALDNAELEGFIDPNSTRLEEVIKDYYVQKTKEYQKPDDLGPKALPVVNEEEEEVEKPEMETILIEEPPTEKWDCESILSTYSNLYNHPKAYPRSTEAETHKGVQQDGHPNGCPARERSHSYAGRAHGEDR
ncbi:hypothetical protein SKAU_G00136820 [Synaphobranchus kaupii]|uniref:Protein LTV1 homolog n=1 Tax=Synaphobranchus kaupii TaxID=118154 RepID=A0A9Q1J3L4_SYNKA|nr:hypothetical protein SKAU_G00136820 [Synaphobranchus kaupii]